MLSLTTSSLSLSGCWPCNGLRLTTGMASSSPPPSSTLTLSRADFRSPLLVVFLYLAWLGKASGDSMMNFNQSDQRSVASEHALTFHPSLSSVAMEPLSKAKCLQSLLRLIKIIDHHNITHACPTTFRLSPRALVACFFPSVRVLLNLWGIFTCMWIFKGNLFSIVTIAV